MDAPNWEEIVGEVHRILKPGGQFVFSILHPCFSFVKGGWHQDKSGNRPYFKMDDYFAEGEETWEWNMSRLKYPFRTKIYHRTLSTYYNGVSSNGFVVHKLVEPRPAADVEDERIADSGRVAYYLIFDCGKPGCVHADE